MKDVILTCRVCGREELVMESDSKDYVCSVCCDLQITDKDDLQKFLEKKAYYKLKQYNKKHYGVLK